KDDKFNGICNKTMFELSTVEMRGIDKNDGEIMNISLTDKSSYLLGNFEVIILYCKNTTVNNKNKNLISSLLKISIINKDDFLFKRLISYNGFFHYKEDDILYKNNILYNFEISNKFLDILLLNSYMRKKKIIPRENLSDDYINDK